MLKKLTPVVNVIKTFEIRRETIIFIINYFWNREMDKNML